MPKLGLLLTTGPDAVAFHQGLGLAETALADGIEVYLYCLDEAVTGLTEPRLQTLRGRGLRLYACAYGAQRRQVPVDDRAVFAGLSVLSDVIAATDRFVAFTRAPVPGVARQAPAGDRMLTPAAVAPAATRRRLFVAVASDPRSSGAPAEAVRMAAGVGSWQKVDVTLYLHGPAVGILGEDLEGLVDEDHFSRYLPIVGEWGRPVYVEHGASALAAWGEPSVHSVELGRDALTKCVAEADAVAWF